MSMSGEPKGGGLECQSIYQEVVGVSDYELLMDLPIECLYEIFEYLDILSLCQVADVSKLFRSIAEKLFYKRYEFDYKDTDYKRSTFRRVLCKFGHLITALDDGYCILRVQEPIDMYAISVYCTNLKELSLRGMTIDCNQMRRIFKRLKSLKLVWCEFHGNRTDVFKNCRSLEILYIYHATEGRFIRKRFPKLVDLRYDTSCRTNQTLLKLMSRNPQLRQLLIPVEMNDLFISSVVQHVPDVEILRFSPGVMCPSKIPTYTEQGFMQLVQLKKLKQLLINTKNETYTKSIASLMTGFSQEKVALEAVHLRNLSIYPEEIRSFTNLKAITSIVLHEIEACSDNDVISLATALPSLHLLVLHFLCNRRNHFSVNGLISVLKAGKELQYIHLNAVQRFRIDQTVYEQLVEVVESRWLSRNIKNLFIQICACNCTSALDVPLEFIREYVGRIRFIVDFTEPRFKCVNCTE